MILGDSDEYWFITEGIELSKDVEGLCLEIGLRLGMGTKTIIDAIAEYCPTKIAMAIDPFGSIEYEHREGQFCRLDYTEEMMVSCLTNMHPYALSKGVKWRFFPLEDTEFFTRYSDGVPIYDIVKTKQAKYSFCHADGPHGCEAVSIECEWLYDRMDVGAVICIDDFSDDFLDTNLMKEILNDIGFEHIKTGNKKTLWIKK